MKKHTWELSWSTTPSAQKEEAVSAFEYNIIFPSLNIFYQLADKCRSVSLLGLQDNIFLLEFYPWVYVSSLFILNFWGPASTSARKIIHTAI